MRGHPGARPRRHRPRRGGGPGGVRRRGGAVAGRRPAAEPGRLDRHHRPQQGHRPAPPGVGPRGQARPGGAAAPTRRTAGGGTRARRPAAVDLHLLPPVPGAGVPGGAHPPSARRPGDPGDRPGLPGPGGDDGAADRPGQAQDQGRRDPVPDPDRGAAAGPAAVRAGRALPGLQRGLRGQRRCGPGPSGPVRRGDPPRPRACRADAGRARGRGPARAAAADRVRRGPGRTARSCCCPTRTARCGTAS